MPKSAFETLAQKYKARPCSAELARVVFAAARSEIKQWPPRAVTLRRMLATVDNMVFDRAIAKAIAEHGVYIELQVKKSVDKLDEIAAYTAFDFGNRRILVRFNRKLFEKLFRKGKPKFLACGLVCADRKTCFTHIFLHEVCHVFVHMHRIAANKRLWRQRSHGTMFDAIAKNVFLHQDAEHALIQGFNARIDVNTIRKEAKNKRHMLFFNDRDKLEVVRVRSVRRDRALVETEEGEKMDVPLGMLRPTR